MPLPAHAEVSGAHARPSGLLPRPPATLWVLAWGETRLQLPLALLIAGVGVTLGPELVFVADNLQSSDFERMNTIFKFYMQGWTLFALGGIGALAWLWETAPRWSLAPFRRWMDRRDRRFNAATLRGILAGGPGPPPPRLVRLPGHRHADPPRRALPSNRPSSGRPSTATAGCSTAPCRTSTRTTDCGGYLSFADDYAAIKWLNEHDRRHAGDRRGQHRPLSRQRLALRDQYRPADDPRLGQPRVRSSARSKGSRRAATTCAPSITPPMRAASWRSSSATTSPTSSSARSSGTGTMPRRIEPPCADPYASARGSGGARRDGRALPDAGLPLRRDDDLPRPPRRQLVRRGGGHTRQPRRRGAHDRRRNTTP